MAITAVEQTSGDRFCINFYSADASGTEVLKAASTTGARYWIDKIAITTGADITVTIKDGTTIIVGPLTINDSSFVYRFIVPKQCTANTALNLLADAGAVAGIIEGYSR